MDTEAAQFSNEDRKDHSEQLKLQNQTDLKELYQKYNKGLEETHSHLQGEHLSAPDGLSSVRLEVLKGNLVELPFRVGALVNAANEALTGGGGVDQIVHARAGPSLALECVRRHPPLPENPLVRCPTGSARITGSHGLASQCDHIIHTVGPYLDEAGAPQPILLESCYRSCLQLAQEHQVSSVAFPCISTGYYGYPMKDACEVALRSVRRWCLEVLPVGTPLERIVFVVYNDIEFEIYQLLFRQIFQNH